MPKVSTSYKPGQSGNPKGAPKREWTWAGLMEKYADKIDEAGKGKQKDAVMEKLFQLAKRGDVVAIKELMNRMDGMPTQSTDVTSGGKKLEGLQVIIANEDSSK